MATSRCWSRGAGRHPRRRAACPGLQPSAAASPSAARTSTGVPCSPQAASLSLFADKQIVEIRIPSGKPGKEGSAGPAADWPQAAQGNDSTLTLVMLPRLDKASQNRRLVHRAGRRTAPPAARPHRARPAAAVDCPAPGRARPARGGGRGRPAHPAVLCRPRGRQPAGRAPGDPESSACCYPPGELSRGAGRSGRARTWRATTSSSSARPCSPGQIERAQRMIDGLQAEGEAAVLVHWALAEDIRALKRASTRLQRRQAPAHGAARAAHLGPARAPVRTHPAPAQRRRRGPPAAAAHQVDGIVKGLALARLAAATRWQALLRLALQLAQLAQATAPPAPGAEQAAFLLLFQELLRALPARPRGHFEHFLPVLYLGHSAHRRKPCLRRPATSPASWPQPVK